MKAHVKNTLKKSIKGRISFSERLENHTTFRIGGIPMAWIEPLDIEDLKNALKVLSKENIESFLIGNGSNILASDGRINTAVVKLSSPYFKKIEFNNNKVTCGSGFNLISLTRKCAQMGLAGIEFMAGIPATVGGAIAMNAGGKNENTILSRVEWIKVMERKKQKILTLKKEDFKIRYRNSGLLGYIILEACFALSKKRPRSINSLTDSILQKKYLTQEFRYPNAGCIFKNPENSRLTSGQILSKCELQGATSNDAEFSSKHANFIVNKGKASFKDVYSLIKLAQDVVRNNYGLWLETEIKILK